MNDILVVVLGIVAGCFAIGLFFRDIKKPITIEFKVSILNCLEQALMMFCTITFVMSLEMIFNQWQLGAWKNASLIIRIVSKLFDAGLLVAIIIPLLSILFGKWIERFDLDLCSVYSEVVIKIYFSLVALTNCVWHLYMFAPNILKGNAESSNVFSRVIIWALNIFGTWVGIGFHCKGRIGKEIENIRKSKEPKDWKAIGKYCIPFVGVYIFNLLLLWRETITIGTVRLGKIMGAFYAIIMIAFLIVFVVGLIYIVIMIPSEQRSNRKLSKAIRLKRGKESVKGRYRRINYSLVEKENKKYIVIFQRDVIWKNHEAEVKEIFDEKEISVEDFEYRLCQQKLKEVIKQQTDFIQDGFRRCKENAKEQLISIRESR